MAAHPVSGGPKAALVSPIANRRSLREEVTDSLRAAVVAGQMRPGVVFSVPALAEQLNVSATPVREAMLDLMKEGLVAAVRNKGFRVTELTEKELDDITKLRALLEIPTVRELSLAGKDAELEALRPVAAEIVEAAAAGDVLRYVNVDRSFHLRLLALAGNPRLVAIVDELRARSRLYGLDRLARAGALLAFAGEHAELLDAMRARDPDRAEAVMRNHISHVRGIWAAEESRPD
ncbi:MAG: GntR family transcriptional regulator [Actinomycetia bacterium]|nr:GntR family transcriptional regulator [Actinomycetes bacterium]